ncbi:MAG: transcriptional repressor [Alcanivorax sp.]|uniref:transcriptional repressor n=1 Tax=Alcanivorax sp. TaxID=1872427 RepID=UPI003DA77F0E
MESGEHLLARVGLKATLPRVRILQHLLAANDEYRHLSAEELYVRLLKAGERIGVSTIYRVLVNLEQVGLVTRHQFDQGAVNRSVYELSFGEPHDHMVCVDTDTVIEFRDPVIEARQREIAEAHGYEVVGCELVVRVRRRKAEC